MKESTFWRKLRPLMLEAAPGIVVDRVESWSTPSFPDVSGTWRHRDFWIELKIVRNNRVKMRPGQVQWLKRRWRAGSRCFVLAYKPESNFMTLINGDLAGNLSKNPIYHIDPHRSFFLITDHVWTMLEVICGKV